METKKHLICALTGVGLYGAVIACIMLYHCDMMVWIGERSERLLLVLLGLLGVSGMIVVFLQGFSCNNKCECMDNISVYSNWRNRHNCKCDKCKEKRKT
jgi:hypothetical protein